MNHAITNAAEYRVRRGVGPRLPLFCQRWVRIVVQSVYGARYDTLWRGSAAATARRCLQLAAAGKLPPGVVLVRDPEPSQTQLGDLLYRLTGYGGYGHVGIRSPGNRVAENAATRWGRVHGAIGYRMLLRAESPVPAAWWGPIELAVRLPE